MEYDLRIVFTSLLLQFSSGKADKSSIVSVKTAIGELESRVAGVGK